VQAAGYCKGHGRARAVLGEGKGPGHRARGNKGARQGAGQGAGQVKWKGQGKGNARDKGQGKAGHGKG
jgi:hypothetical protein